MLITVPMAGLGERFLRAGIAQPKPLIEIEGRPLIEHVVRCFPPSSRFLFVINRRHAEESDLVSVLERLAPSARTVAIDPHKDGPVRSLLAASDLIPDDEEVIVNHCDFGVDWDYDSFSSWLARGQWDGAMTAYRGFHPHSLGPTLYAYMRNEGDRVLEVREKHHFTTDRMSEYASSGFYYFRRGELLKRLAAKLVARGERVMGEFFVSTAMQGLVAEGGRVGVYELKRFFQWGTPEDLADYESWARSMRRLDDFRARLRGVATNAVQILPMAGRGQRFRDQGYAQAKPLIEVAGQPMFRQALACLPTPSMRVLLSTSDLRDGFATADQAAIRFLDQATEGQACTALLGLDGLAGDTPVLIAPCDTGYVYDPAAWSEIEREPRADLVVWTARDYLPSRWRPSMYGFVCADSEGQVVSTSVKCPIEGAPPAEHEVIVGTFFFPRAATFREETRAMWRADDRVNGEFYIDTIVRRMAAAGRRVRVFRLAKYIPFGTPEELKTFLYWNDVFRGGRPWL